MDKMQSRADARAFLRSAQAFAALDQLDQHVPRTSRERVPPPLDKARARQACAPMGTLHSIVVTVNAHKRRRTWYVVDPDLALSAAVRRGRPRPHARLQGARRRRGDAPGRVARLRSGRQRARRRSDAARLQSLLRPACRLIAVRAQPCVTNRPKSPVAASASVTRSTSTTKSPARPTSSFIIHAARSAQQRVLTEARRRRSARSTGAWRSSRISAIACCGCARPPGPLHVRYVAHASKSTTTWPSRQHVVADAARRAAAGNAAIPLVEPLLPGGPGPAARLARVRPHAARGSRRSTPCADGFARKWSFASARRQCARRRWRRSSSGWAYAAISPIR